LRGRGKEVSFGKMEYYERIYHFINNLTGKKNFNKLTNFGYDGS